PSHMGLLLNISRRNLDRVLYFAQYVITHVDEDSRQRALKRLDDELGEAEMKLEDDLQLELDAETEELAQRRLALEVELEGLNARYDELVSRRTDQVVQEAKVAEQRVQNMLGAAAAEDLMLGELTIIRKGETIGREHLVTIQNATR